MQKKNYSIRFLSSLKSAFKLVYAGNYSILYNEIKKRLYSESLSFGLKRDLKKPVETPSAKINIHIREFFEADVDVLLGNSTTTNPRIIASRRALIDANISTCYVAVTTNNIPCYMQWLIGSKDNDKIESYFRGIFPPLKPREALLEGDAGNTDFRGLRIMPEAMARIAEKATLINARWVNTFVETTNIPSLKGCRRSGFEPYILRKDKWVLFRRNTSFHPLSDKVVEEYHKNTASKTQLKREKSIKKEILQPQFQP